MSSKHVCLAYWLFWGSTIIIGKDLKTFPVEIENWNRKFVRASASLFAPRTGGWLYIEDINLNLYNRSDRSGDVAQG